MGQKKKEGEHLETLSKHKDKIRYLLRLNENHLISCGTDGKLVIWNTETKETVEEIESKHKEPIFQIIKYKSQICLVSSHQVTCWRFDPK